MITGTVEFDRDLPRNFGVAAFFDYGNAFNHFGAQCTLVTGSGPPHQECHGLLQYGAGLGFRVRLPVLTLGIDIGAAAVAVRRPAALHQLLAEAVRAR